MPRRPHDPRDCDEFCVGCTACYPRTGEWACDWHCPHAAEAHADEIAEHDEQAQWERAESEAQEPRR